MAILTDSQRQSLDAMLDRIVPVQGGKPGAGQVGVANFLEKEAANSSSSARGMLNFVKLVEAASGRANGASFIELDPGKQDAVLTSVESDEPDLFGLLVGRVYSGYYSNPDVVALLPKDAGPPQPSGFPIKPFDPGIVAKVRKLGPRFRKV